MNECYVNLTGVQYPKSAVAARSLGWLPTPIVVTALPQTQPLPGSGNLTLGFGSDTVTFQDVKFDFASTHLTTRGHVMIIRLLDRRWRWNFLPISGRYNVRAADGTIETGTRRSIRELAILLFQAMFELTYDVSALPDNVYPEVDWVWDKAALRLAELCEMCGCDICLNIDNTVKIVRLGVGELLPANGDIQSVDVTANPPEMPNKLVVVCGETQYESRLKLTAVAMDTNGEVHKIDASSLSYMTALDKPSDGKFYEGMADDGFDVNQIALARKTAFRWFQIESQADGTLDLPVSGFNCADIKQILPVNTWRLDTYTAAVGSLLDHKPDTVIGKFLEPGDPPPDEKVDEIQEYDGEFSVDRRNGIVKFPRAMFNRDDDGNLIAAELYLITSYGLRLTTTGQQDRAYVERVLSSGPLTEVINVEEIAYKIRAEYSNTSDPTAVTGTDTNQAEVQDEANRYLDAAQARYQNAVYGSGKYRGLQQINLDGAIRQMVWVVDDQQGANTYASRNTETYRGIPRAAERRRWRIAEANSNGNRMNHIMRGIQSGGVSRR